MATLEASGLAADLDPTDIPMLDGAAALSAAGVRSSIFEANQAYLADRISVPEGLNVDLLFDPQTAGGLLAVVPEDIAGEQLRRLSDAGYTAARIGQLKAGGPHITLTG